MTSNIPLQENADYSDPEQALAWTLVNSPGMTPQSAPLTIPGPLGRCLSKHQRELGVVHVDELRALANEDGFIHVDQLPVQSKKYQRPVRGQQVDLNNASRWVPMDTPDPEPIVIQDPQAMTRPEIEALKARLADMGELPTVEYKPDVAEVLE